LITLISLVVGITTILLLTIWVQHEWSHNKDIVDYDRMYALLIHDQVDGEISTEDGTRIPLMDFLANEVTDIEAVSRIDNRDMRLANGTKSIHKSGVYADSSFFAVHTPDQLQGEMANKGSIAISTVLARELFADEEAIGRTISVDPKTDYLVSAIYSPYPKNSSFHYIHFVLPYSARALDADDWTYHDIKLFDPASRADVEELIDKQIAQLSPGGDTKSQLFALDDWRLRWNFENGKSSGGRIVYVIIFSITGIFVLLMACINYMNISTAQATKRMREIGVRKMTGATQSNLIRQFMLEGLVMTSVSAFLSVILAYLLLPYFNQLVGAQLVLSFKDPMLGLGLMLIVVFTTLLAGGYPAWVLSSFKPIAVLNSNLYAGNGGVGLRKILVVFQFTLSVIMIFCSLIMWQQTDFLLKQDLGYDKHRVINIWLDGNHKSSIDNLRAEVQAHTAIESAGFAGASPMEVNGYAQCNRASDPFESPLLFYGANIDEQVLSTLNFELVSGRNFSRAHVSDSLNFVITQHAADLLGFEDPIGERITFDMFGPQEGEVVGVIKDFQHDDIHTPIRPVVFVYGKYAYLNNMFVRYQEGKVDAALQHIKSTFEQVQPGTPVNFSFLDSDFETQLYRERLLGNISIAFTAIAVIIACLGLFGLVIFNAQRRTKEIGIRKVLGASVSQVTVLLCRDFFPPVFCSFLIAFPIGYYLMQKFLEDYATRISISWGSFLMVAVVMVLVLLITISQKSLKAAKENPIDSLKTE
jgi:ABC-type antimicrobial peptide transport system permease subunit